MTKINARTQIRPGTVGTELLTPDALAQLQLAEGLKDRIDALEQGSAPEPKVLAATMFGQPYATPQDALQAYAGTSGPLAEGEVLLYVQTDTGILELSADGSTRQPLGIEVYHMPGNAGYPYLAMTPSLADGSVPAIQTGKTPTEALGGLTKDLLGLLHGRVAFVEGADPGTTLTDLGTTLTGPGRYSIQGVSSFRRITVYVNGVRQPASAYTNEGGELVFTEAPEASDSVVVDAFGATPVHSD